MDRTVKRNAGLMNLIKRMHGVVENVDIEKHRQSQDHFGALLGNNRDVIVEDVEITPHKPEDVTIHGEIGRASCRERV